MSPVTFSLVSICLSLIPTIRAAGCQIDIKQLPERHPLYLSPGTKEIIYPDVGNSIINLQNNENFEMDCPGDGTIQLGDQSTQQTASAQCLSGWNVEILGGTFNLSSIVCTKRITAVTRYTGQCCWGPYREIEIGFQIHDGPFLRQITVCFDDVERNVIYSQFLLTKEIGSQTTGNSRPGWTEGSFYNLEIKLENLYPNAAQRRTINRQLGLTDDDTQYVDSTGQYYLSKGHLTAKTDFMYNAQQQATFQYVNSVPQWQTFNSYNWYYFERNVRVYASENMVDLIVYTGPFGILTLPHHSTGEEVPLYLFLSEDNQQRSMPIPELFWKIIYDPVNEAGVAVLGINNPFQTNISKSIICNDIADELTWLTFDRFKIEAGYMYACEIEDLRRMIPDIPAFPVKHILK